MDSGPKRIGSLFGADRLFVVPPYQRSYAWRNQQLKDFLDDLSVHDAAKDYFLGTCLFQETILPDGFERVDVVDGQQRLTTVVVLMKCLADEFARRSPGRDVSLLGRRYLRDGDRVKLQVQQSEREFFNTFVIGDVRPTQFEFPSQRRLHFAKEFFREALSARGDTELEALRAKVEGATVLTYSVKDTGEATLIFETVNDRGKGLSDLEKVKSFLMYRTYQVAEHPADQLNDIQSRFGDIFRAIDDLDQLRARVDENALLRYQYIANFDWVPKKSEKPYDHAIREIKLHFDGILSDRDKALEQISWYSADLRDCVAAVLSLHRDGSESVRNLFVLDRMANSGRC